MSPRVVPLLGFSQGEFYRVSSHECTFGGSHAGSGNGGWRGRPSASSGGAVAALDAGASAGSGVASVAAVWATLPSACASAGAAATDEPAASAAKPPSAAGNSNGGGVVSAGPAGACPSSPSPSPAAGNCSCGTGAGNACTTSESLAGGWLSGWLSSPPPPPAERAAAGSGGSSAEAAVAASLDVKRSLCTAASCGSAHTT